ncbi:MAG: GNAT family N-acetyltransferase [Clostridia bacterium]|nr:GNAT family N-acetyltransferase [Clostridia bacterium]
MMTTIETDRLRMRPFTDEDYPLILEISAHPDTIRYLYFWGRNGITPEDDARRFLAYALKNWARDPIRAREYCVELKETGESLGDASVEWVEGSPGTAEIGWILLPRCRGQGYATEAGKALMDAAFARMGAERVIAHCDARNAASYHVMERLGMRLTGIDPAARPGKLPGDPPGDEFEYAINRHEWQVHQAFDVYHRLTCQFTGFVSTPELTDGEITLTLDRVKPAEPGRNRVPAYCFHIMRDGQSIGGINLRIGYPDSLLYGGQIGYHVEEAWRGRGYAGAACRLLLPLLRAHGMTAAVITNNITNAASRRVCEKLGARLLCQAPVPPDHEMYAEGERAVNVFLWEVK